MTEAAWKFNVSRVRISKVIQEKVGSGAIPKRFNRSQKLRDPSLKELIKCALMGGHSLTKVARDFQVSLSRSGRTKPFRVCLTLNCFCSADVHTGCILL